MLKIILGIIAVIILAFLAVKLFGFLIHWAVVIGLIAIVVWAIREFTKNPQAKS